MPAAGITELTADRALGQQESISHFLGNVQVRRDKQQLYSDRASYDHRSERVRAEGHILYSNEQLALQGEKAEAEMGKEAGQFDNADFYFPQRHGFGYAEKIIVQDADHSTLQKVRYSTCNPEVNGWLLSASRMEIDETRNLGQAYNAVFRFKGVPLLYTPYIDFPLSGRKSGLLFPTIDISSVDGTDISQPVYWNIAPNYDATITPRNITGRGQMAMGEFRFLTEQTRGSLTAEYLPDDRIYGATREYYSINHQAQLGAGWSSQLVAHKTSDADYLNDLATSQGTTAKASHLERRFDLNYGYKEWKFLARMQDYQTLLGTEPYRRLPQLTLTRRAGNTPNNLQWDLQSEAVAFRHESKKPQANRLDIKPSVSYPLQGTAWFLTPKLAVRHTQYQLQDSILDQPASRNLPIASLDGGLFFERELNLGDSPYIQTLEPRLYALYVPYREQDDLPRFDTGLPAINTINHMFRDNRFSGADRQGDAKQITAALTSRFISEDDGRERVRASIAQIHYFTDREVGLTPTQAVDTREFSDIATELAFSPLNSLNFSLNALYDPYDNKSEQLSGKLRFSPGKKRVLNIDYIYKNRTGLQRQVDTSLLWPISRQWQFIGRWKYDIDNEAHLDLLGGLEYESCCWAVRLLARNQRDTLNDDLEHSVFITFEFKGMGRFGKKLESSLEDGLLNY